MDAKPTPGPWAVNPQNAQVDAMPSMTPVCKLLWPTKERSEAETEANAHLIAAAPDLINFARALNHGLRMGHAADELLRDGGSLRALLCVVIAKATGSGA